MSWFSNNTYNNKITINDNHGTITGASISGGQGEINISVGNDYTFRFQKDGIRGKISVDGVSERHARVVAISELLKTCNINLSPYDLH